MLLMTGSIAPTVGSYICPCSGPTLSTAGSLRRKAVFQYHINGKLAKFDFLFSFFYIKAEESPKQTCVDD
jgi:hypothetical protein